MRYGGALLAALILPIVVQASALVNINTANATLLDTLPGIGPSKAAAIVDYRTKHGSFSTIDAIQNVSGIGPVTFSKLKSLITVDTTTVAPPAAEKPSPPSTSYTKVQKVESVISPTANIQTHDAVGAPAAANELAAAGAALLPTTDAPPSHTTARAEGLLHSPWLFGLVGVIVLAGGIFVFL